LPWKFGGLRIHFIQQNLIDNVTVMTSDALLTIVLKKHYSFEELRQSELYDTFLCITIMGSRQPYMTTRLFFRKLSTDLKLPVVGLMYCDSYGFKIMNVYRYVAKSKAFYEHRLTTLGVQWLGLRSSDLNLYGLKSESMLENDIKFTKSLLDKDFVKINQE
jgi:meiotic recombination protein SPO11